MPGPSSPEFAWIAAGGCVLMVLGTLAVWTRLRGAPWLRVAQRLVLIVGCQATALAVVFAVVNLQNLFYTSWSDVLGRADTGQVTVQDDPAQPSLTAASQTVPSSVTAPTSPAPTSPAPTSPAPTSPAPTSPAPTSPATADPGRPVPSTAGPFTLDTATGLYSATVTGARSGFTGRILVWLPPGTTTTSALPGMLALPGVPGDPVDPFNGMHLAGQVATSIEHQVMRPTAVVAASITADGRGHDCANVPGQALDTWLSQDVPDVVGASLPVSTGVRWATLGLSSGGECAIRLAMAHPDRFGPAASLSGDDAPDSKTSGAAPLSRLVAAGSSTPVDLLLFASLADTSTTTTAKAVAAAAGKGVAVTVAQVSSGGHNWRTWAAMTPDALTWIAQHTAH